MRGKPEPDDSALAARIRELKNTCHISLQQLADAIGKSKSTVFQYMTGETRVTRGVLRRIAKAFGCDERYLLMPPGSPLPKPTRKKPDRRLTTLRLDGSFAMQRAISRCAEFDIDLNFAVPVHMAPDRFRAALARLQG